MMSFRPRNVRLFASAFLLSMMAGAAGAAAPAAAGDAKAAAAPNTAAVSPDGLISRSVLFGNPDRTALRVSPDGKRVAFIAPVAGVLNVWVAPINDIAAAKPVTKDTSRGIRQYFWAYNNNDLLYLQDVGGDENWKVYRVNLETSKVTDLTPFETINGPDGKPIMLPTGQPLRPAAQIEAVSHKFPNHILIGLNNRNPQFHDIYRVDLSTGALTLLFTNDQWASISTDDNYDIRLASKMTSDGGIEYFKAAASAAKPGKENEPASITFESFIKVSQQDSMTTSPMGFSKDGQTLYMLDSRDRNTAALVSKDLKTGKITLLAEDAKADAGGVMMHPTEKTVQAVSFEYLRDEWKVLDKSIEPDLAYLRTVSEGDMNVTSRSLDDKTWVVAFAQDKGPARSYIYDRAAKKATFAFSNKQSLEGLPLQAMKPVVIKSRDGLDLVSYLTLPMGSDKNNDGKPDAPVPLVLNVHGGPWARDSWASTPKPSGSPTAATRVSKSTSAGPPASARASSTPPTSSGPRRCTTTSSTPSTGPSRKASPTRARSPSTAVPTAATPPSSVSPSRPTPSPARWRSSARAACRPCSRASRPTGRRRSKCSPPAWATCARPRGRSSWRSARR